MPDSSADKWAQYEVGAGAQAGAGAGTTKPAKPAKPDKWAQYEAAPSTAPSSSAPAAPTGTLRPPSDRERFLNPELYPVGVHGEGLGENLHNLAQRTGVGVFQLADAATHPRQTVAGMLSSVLPDPVVRAVNQVVDLENKIPGAHYLTTHLPENVPNPLQQAYRALQPGGWQAAGNVAPVAGQALAGDAVSLAGPAIWHDVSGWPESVARAATDTGSGPVKRLVKKTQKANEKIDDVNADRVDRQQKDQIKANADHRADLLKLKQTYDQSVRDAAEKARTGTASDRDQYQSRQLAAKQKYDQSVRDAQGQYETRKAAIEQSNAEAQRAYNQKIGETARHNRAATEAVQAKSDQAAGVQVGGSQLIYGLRQLDQTLRARANQMYNVVHERMADASLPSDTLAGAVKAAQEKWIRGSPAKVAEFNAMLSTGAPGPELTLADQTAQNLGYKDFRTAITNPAIRSTLSRALPPDVWQAAVGQGTKPISWNDLQGLYEETGARIAEGPQPGKGGIFKALQQVHNEIGNQMMDLAATRGMDKQFGAARKFYRDYMDTFHEPTGPSSSGSPVAQALQAKDPEVAVSKFAGDSGDRGIATLRKYSDSLANLAQDVRQRAQAKVTVPARKSAAAIPAPALKPVPAGPSLPLPPVLESAPAPRGAALPLPPVIPDAPVVPLELRPRQTISAPDLAAARVAAHEARTGEIWSRGQWAATWPIFQAARALWGGHIPSIPVMGLESAGMLATVQATTQILRYPPMVKFLTQARPEDLALIPPDLRGDLPGLVSIAQRQGIRVAPALVAAATATAGQQNPPPPATPALTGAGTTSEGDSSQRVKTLLEYLRGDAQQGGTQ